MNRWYRSKIFRRTVFVLCNSVFCVAVGAALVLPAYTFFSDRNALINDRRGVLARLTAVAVQKNNAQNIERSIETELQRGEFLAGSNDHVINAELQTRVKALIVTAGAQPRAVQGLPLRTTDKIEYSGVRLDINGSLQSIYRAIFAIEAAKPYLFITNAAIKVTPSNGPSAHQAEPIIQAQLEVFGAVQFRGREQ
ncbi:MAG TPA: type II secretion system protein GspM [Pseudolabrys sp.]|nr:type II secretion system protein GspM [Pseudolabrys sp.]